MNARLVALLAGQMLVVACGGAAARLEVDERLPPVPFAVEVVSFEPGPGAGYGQALLPDVVLGPPAGAGVASGGEDVLSLGRGGSITLRLGVPAVDGDGPDLVVFENPFLFAGGVFAEPAQVSVSSDGEDWRPFPCAPLEPAPNGCAGYEPVLADDDEPERATDPSASGGDRFDLASLDDAPEQAWLVRVDDRGASELAPTAGFDLDAIAVVPR